MQWAISTTQPPARAPTVVLVHADGNLRIGIDGGGEEQAQERVAGTHAGPGGGLHDDGGADFARGGHDGLNLFEVVDVEGGHAVAVFGGVIEQLTHGNEGHGGKLRSREKRKGTAGRRPVVSSNCIGKKKGLRQRGVFSPLSPIVVLTHHSDQEPG